MQASASEYLPSRMLASIGPLTTVTVLLPCEDVTSEELRISHQTMNFLPLLCHNAGSEKSTSTGMLSIIP